MPTLKTGSPRIKATIQTSLLLNEGETINDPVADAKQKAAQAQDEADGVEKEQQRSDANVQADKFRQEAQNRTEVTKGYQSNSPQGKKAHAIAALAHSDAQKAYSKQASVASGNSLETRAKSQKLADEHSKMCDHHEQMAQGTLMGKGTLNQARACGSKTTSVYISRPLTDNAWSDAAREASAESRRSGGGAKAESPQKFSVGTDAYFREGAQDSWKPGKIVSDEGNDHYRMVPKGGGEAKVIHANDIDQVRAWMDQ
jgi:hypothetical protein